MRSTCSRIFSRKEFQTDLWNIFLAPVTHVEAGDRLKLGWVSNNHGGGYVRISLVPFGQHRNPEKFKANVLKFACYGKETRPNTFSTGDCLHPCNARPGCEYQSSMYSNDSKST